MSETEQIDRVAEKLALDLLRSAATYLREIGYTHKDINAVIVRIFEKKGTM